MLLIAIMMALLFSACQSSPSIAGRWQAEPPSSLLFEFSDDGVVYLLDGLRSYQVFRFKFTSENTIELYDGMGRIRVFTVSIYDDKMTFFDIESGIPMELYQRVSDDPH
ncbi:MAG: hypothetical protein DWQ07_25600 [Chloroflexi bacterium]|nr:MAG: hypothetical protein DWQ07_25600 [Chloroflexota bacterium]MBL1197193.1 hypothetical protein [Chloroflexota bacterium]